VRKAVGDLHPLPGWLWLLAAIGYLDRPDEDHHALFSQCPFPVALVGLAERRFLLMSPPLVEILGQRPGPVQSFDTSVMVEDPRDLGALFGLMASGAVDLYGVSREIRRQGSDLLQAETWTAISDTEQRTRALWVVSPTAEEGNAAYSSPPALDWPDQVAGLVIGSFDDEWRISRISADVQAVLGYRAEELIGRKVIDLIHPDDVAGLFSSAATAITDQAGISTRRRLRHRNGEWVEVRGVITPVPDDRLRLGFAFSAAWADRDRSAPSAAARAAVLERHLWRIASEVAASGVAGFRPAVTPDDVPGLDELSPRQWQVLTRLLNGERVPAIAAQLFISESTVRNHLTDIFRKVGVRSQGELLRLLRRGNAPQGP
jgi:PAS domain S-box-containing protein